MTSEFYPAVAGAPELPWLPIARAEIGEREIAGSEANPRIAEYLHTTSLPESLADTDETPWCSAFVNWCLKQVGVKGTGSAAARSWLSWGRPIVNPVPGCIAVFTRQGGGHVAFFLRYQGRDPIVLGGNQGNQVCERVYPADRLLGFRLPLDFSLVGHR